MNIIIHFRTPTQRERTLGPVARLRTRSMYTLLNSRLSWYDSLEINDETRGEILFWNSCIDCLIGRNYGSHLLQLDLYTLMLVVQVLQATQCSMVCTCTVFTLAHLAWANFSPGIHNSGNHFRLFSKPL